MEEPDTVLFHVEPFEDALGDGYRILRSEDHVYEVREHDGFSSMVYWTTDTPSTGEDDGYYAKVRADVGGDEEAYHRFQGYAERLEEAYDIELGIDPRTFHAEREEDAVVQRDTTDFLVRYVQENQLEPKPFGGPLLRRMDGRRRAKLEAWTLMDVKDTLDRMNRRNALKTVLPEMDRYDTALNRELDRLKEETIRPPWQALKRYQFYDHHRLPGVAARHHTATYDEAMDALQTMIDVDVAVERPSVYTTPDAFTTFLNHLSFTDADGEHRLTEDGEILLRNALERDELPSPIAEYLEGQFPADIRRIKQEQLLDGGA